MLNRNEPIAIHQLMNRFEQGDMSLLDQVADDIHLSIDHFNHNADTGWQRCAGKQDLIRVLTRLAEEVFPKGTKFTHLSTRALGEQWYLTKLEQKFWYGLEQQEVKGESFILSHETDGKVDYFKETVTAVIPLQSNVA